MNVSYVQVGLGMSMHMPKAGENGNNASASDTEMRNAEPVSLHQPLHAHLTHLISHLGSMIRYCPFGCCAAISGFYIQLSEARRPFFERFLQSSVVFGLAF